MRLATLLAFSSLLACKSQPPTVAPSEPAVAPAADEDQWNGFGGNDQPDEPPAETRQAAQEPRDAVGGVCKKMFGLSGMNTEGLEDSVKVEMMEGCRAQFEGMLEIDPEAFEIAAACADAAETLEQMQACAQRESDSLAQEPVDDSGDLVAQVCQKMAQLVDQEPDVPEEAKRELRDIDKCLVEAGAERDDDPEKFERMATCILQPSVTSMEGVVQCAVES